MIYRDPSTAQTHAPAAGPAVYAAIGFAAGIVAGTAVHPGWLASSGILCAALLAALIFRRYEHIADTTVLIAIFAAGIVSVTASEAVHRPLPLSDAYLNRTITITGVVSAEPRIFAPGAARVVVTADSMTAGGVEVAAHGRIPVYIYRQADGLAEGARIRVRGAVKRYRSFAASPDFSYRIVAGSDDGDSAAIAPAGSFIAHIRRGISGLIDRYAFGGHREIVRAITIGDRSFLPEDTRAAFARSGIAHVLAVSGLHAGIVILALGALLSLFPLGRGIRALLITGMLILYAALCGFRPPVVRAAVMLALLTIGPLFGRTGQRENSLAVALILILAADPASLFGPSLQLSFAAVWGIVTFHRPAMHWLTGDRNLSSIVWIPVSAAVISAVAFLATAPIIAVHFGRLPLFSLVVNLPAVFIMVAVVPLSWIAILLSALGPFGAPAASVAAYLTGLLLQLLDMIAGAVASLPFASPETAVPGIAALLLIAGAAAFSRRSRGSVYLKASVFLPLAAFLIITWEPIARARSQSAGGSVVFFDVGQGDAALVEYPDGRRFLIDTGPSYGSFNSGAAIIVPWLRSIGATRLDGVFISHTHADHTGGLGEILASVDVGAVFCRAGIADSLGTVLNRRVTGLAAGDSLAFPGGGILVMAPCEDERLAENDASLLLRFNMADARILFTGDIEEGRQHLLGAWRDRLAADVMKAPHHGGDIDEPFLALVHPATAVISCGAGNRYGHPSPEVLAALERSSPIEVLRTDRDGALLIEMPALKVNPF